ncbi:MAG: hypothetical protein U9R36_04210, partial [Elusimicrobiota bacterium]|nr:hypothetical protein [Elusimicrobiota bacterium]
MKKIIITTVCALLLHAVSAAVAEAGTVSLIPSYGILMSPDMSDYDDISTGGLGFTLQGFFGTGKKKVEWGAEIGTQAISKYGEGTEFTEKATPVMGLFKYNIESAGEFKPYMLIGGGL